MNYPNDRRRANYPQRSTNPASVASTYSDSSTDATAGSSRSADRSRDGQQETSTEVRAPDARAGSQARRPAANTTNGYWQSIPDVYSDSAAFSTETYTPADQFSEFPSDTLQPYVRAPYGWDPQPREPPQSPYSQSHAGNEYIRYGLNPQPREPPQSPYSRSRAGNEYGNLQAAQRPSHRGPPRVHQYPPAVVNGDVGAASQQYTPARTAAQPQYYQPAAVSNNAGVVGPQYSSSRNASGDAPQQYPPARGSGGHPGSEQPHRPTASSFRDSTLRSQEISQSYAPGSSRRRDDRNPSSSQHRRYYQ